MAELARGCWEGHLSGRELTHLLSVWSTPPGHKAQCYRWGSGERLSLIGSDCSYSGQLGALPPVQLVPALKQRGPAARLLQFLDHAEPSGALRELRVEQTSWDINFHIWMCL